MTKSWKHGRAQERINKRFDEVKDVSIVDYKRDMSLESIPTNKAYRLDGVHLYVDILNLSDMLNVTRDETETTHKRTLRFLNLHYRAVHRILKDCDVIRVDFHNQRLHAVVAKPYNTEDGAEGKRVRRAVAIGQLIKDVLAETGDDDQQIPNAKVRIGVDTGIALAVNNGRRAGREPLFLGHPANFAAKLAGGGTAEGIYISNAARTAVGWKIIDEDAQKRTALTKAEVEECQNSAKLETDKDKIVKAWRQDLKDNPIGSFSFSGHTPPLRTLQVVDLTPANSRRQDVVSVYGDIAGFTPYVKRNIDDDPEDVVRVFHVIRAELDHVVTDDFDGRRIRFVGDCIHGLLCGGTAQTTDKPSTVSTSTLCAGGMRSSFDLAIKTLKDKSINVDGLGLAVGFDLGPTATTRLGMQGDRVRCSVSRGVLQSEAEQDRCDGTQTAIGKAAYDAGTDAVRNLFGANRIVADLDYNEAVEGLAESGDSVAKAARDEAFAAVKAPAVARTADTLVRPYAEPHGD
ncbi:transcriptional regulator [Roseiarcaceae bacterium H3SJ34-1]|uniref:transcriptional regulator n=1 Tax=Terripilifer ovatus TaxID=3032367 RepID=UPI003AB94DC5|nr:transcriptional regulator [Roseiarcaceae bacterium H3SJ34-1]